MAHESALVNWLKRNTGGRKKYETPAKGGRYTQLRLAKPGTQHGHHFFVKVS